ncbi:hypothetical protein BO71DRAFT_230654 [Aspergillus ellipticus CBS 707.79]|uniref:Alpha/beta hydrolase fold-3 domain-containing protein n=1 Tax=Aspergillus ellipticus CBS 707.79 TaxID=1448320 RepID=A0A319DAX5_9EURO|nr:hypothetical protein BO71DRAFT_230654 [Aspergillus ellipticus CBS 707.79]
MMSRKDIHPMHIQMLLNRGFIPVSVDYRLCPEVGLLDGHIEDVCDEMVWARNILPSLALKRSDIRLDGNRVAAVGWSSGGHLAMTLGWTAVERGIKPPEAILAFYPPIDYEDSFWAVSQPSMMPPGLDPNYTQSAEYSTIYAYTTRQSIN